MEENERQKYETQAQELRAALKQFEGDWAKKNDGKKPGRNDIKANPIIAQKYKKYNHVRDILDGKIQPPKKKESKTRTSKPETATTQTPSKRSRPAATPSRPKPNVDLLDGIETPSIRRLFSPVVPTSIGPTPQRDGKILGLFDLLDENDDKTPSRPRHGDATIPTQVNATPTKRTHSEMEIGSTVKLGRTPQSSSKRIMLDSFMTPLKNRDNNVQDSKSPSMSTASKLQFATPAFLRRAPLPPLNEEGKYVSPQPIRLPRKPLVRGLSSVVASLRKLEEDKLDEELEAMHEMEDVAAMGPPMQAPKAKESQKENILERDSQSHQLLGGFDDEGELDSDPEPQLGRDGLPLRIYKKKGQKRTTRKVNMRPTRAKRPQQSLEEPGSDAENDDPDVVPETQFDATRTMDGEEPLDLDSDAEFAASDDDGYEKQAKKPKAKKKETAGKEEKENPIKKAAKKVNAMAHANFKRLKLRNNGAKGGPGFGSKFRRRR